MYRVAVIREGCEGWSILDRTFETWEEADDFAEKYEDENCICRVLEP